MTASTKRMRGMGSVYERGGVWWIVYHHNGVRHRESSGSTNRRVAVNLLKTRHTELTANGRTFAEARLVTLASLHTFIENDYALNERRSEKRLGQAWAHVDAAFGKDEPAVSITPARLAAYVETRTSEGATPGTIRIELAALKRGFTLARKAGALKANECPTFPTIGASRPRVGFLERGEHERILAALPSDEADMVEFLFWSAWRVGEAKGLRWANVDETNRVIRIEQTKSGTPRTLPYGALPQLVEVIERRRKVTDAVQRKRDMVVSHVFHRNGEPIHYFRRAWLSACKAAGVPGRLVHDLRRSAARNMVRASIPQPVAMAIGGWKTDSVFRRYAIVDERVIAEGLAKLALHAHPFEPGTPRVVALGSTR